MAISGMFNYTDILGKAMQTAVLRDSVISNNIANAETPGFKRNAVRFESYLENAVDNFRRTNVLDLSGIRPRIVAEFSDFYYRFDENNVDIEAEMVDLYQNSVRFDTMAAGILNYYRIINMVLTAQF
ncbi:MAG: flagellar basal body rod protein FlgB [Defluviitaleaceae bacterium]|nr:flagellar basal body rod protein FlgB [Defluviitaleaceae bacterium]